MQKIIVLVLLLVAAPGCVHADYFQVFDASGKYYIPYASVMKDNSVIGYTDAYGRVKIDLPKGECRVQIKHRGNTMTSQLTIDGSTVLKKAKVF